MNQLSQQYICREHHISNTEIIYQINNDDYDEEYFFSFFLYQFFVFLLLISFFSFFGKAKLNEKTYGKSNTEQKKILDFSINPLLLFFEILWKKNKKQQKSTSTTSMFINFNEFFVCFCWNNSFSLFIYWLTDWLTLWLIIKYGSSDKTKQNSKKKNCIKIEFEANMRVREILWGDLNLKKIHFWISLSLSFLIRFKIMKWKTKQKISDYRIYSIWLLKISMLLFFGGVGDYFDLNWLEKQTNNYHYVNVEQTNKQTKQYWWPTSSIWLYFHVCVCVLKKVSGKTNNFLVLN